LKKKELIVIGTELIRELVESVIFTGRLKDVNPVSLLLIADPESGKTSIVLDRPCKAVEAFTDITGRGIQMVLAQNKDLTHIVINDMVAILSHRQAVNRYTISMLNALTEEGLSAVASPAGVEKFANSRKGVITSLTTDMANDNRNWWNKVGFASRMLPFCYQYPKNLLIEIKQSIDDLGGKSAPEKLKKEFLLPLRICDVKYERRFIERVRRLADIRSQILEEQGMRRLKQYHALVKGHALLRGVAKAEVGQVDIDFLEEVDLFVTYDKPRELTYK
jgi:hypothetical protein